MKNIPDFGAIAPTASSATPHVIDASQLAGERIALPMGNELLDAGFVRSGRDLSVEADGHRAVVITDYFAAETAPALISESGKLIRGETVSLLSGNPSANMYAGPVEGAAPIGAVEKMAGDVFVKRADGSEMKLNEGDEVYQDDIIRTEGDGSIGITFIDGSVFTLGNDARMTLDELVYDASTGEGTSSVTVIKGMFKFISGDIAANNPGDMVVETPVATIGIRGTTGGGNVIGPGADNQFFLEPNADGTVGWFDVTTDGGTISMNQPYMNVGISDIGTPPPPPGFTTPDAINQQFGSMNPFTPEGRYHNRPDGNDAGDDNQPQLQNETQGQNEETPPAEGEEATEETGEGEETEQNAGEGEETLSEASELMGESQLEGEGPPPSETMGDGQPEGGEQTGEGTNNDELTQAEGEQELAMTGDANFDGQSGGDEPSGDTPQTTQTRSDDPTQDPMNQFINKGTMDQLVNSTPPPPPPSGNIGTTNTGTTSGTTTQQAGTQPPPPPTTTTNSDSEFFQAIQEQIRLGNLSPDVLTNPDKANELTDFFGGTLPPPPPPPPPEDNTVINDGTIDEGGTDTTPPEETTVTPAPSGPFIRPIFRDDLLETIQGGNDSDIFVVSEWDQYMNPNALAPDTGQADILRGGAGFDVLRLDDHTATFSDVDHLNISGNTATFGIDSIQFRDDDLDDDGTPDATMLNVSLTGGANGAFVQANPSQTLNLGLGARDTDINLSGMTGVEQLVLNNDNNNVTLGGDLNGATLNLLGSTSLTSTTTGDAFIKFGAGINSADFGGSSANYHFAMHAGTQTAIGSFGADTFTILGGSAHSLVGGDGDDHYFVEGVHNVPADNISLEGGAGNDAFIIDDSTGVTVSGNAGDNVFDSIDGTNLTLIGDTGNDTFIVEGGSNVNIQGGGGENFYEIGDSFSQTTGNINITGGTQNDRFSISGDGTITADGGAVGSGFSNYYEFYDFGGTANVTVYTGGSSDADVLRLNHLDSTAQVNLSLNAASTTANVALDFMGPDSQFDDFTINPIGSNLKLTTASGADVTLNNFFTGDNQYILETEYHEPYGLVKGDIHTDTRFLNTEQYQNIAKGIVDFGMFDPGTDIMNIDNANPMNSDFIEINGMQFYFVNDAGGSGNRSGIEVIDIDAGSTENSTTGILTYIASMVPEAIQNGMLLELTAMSANMPISFNASGIGNIFPPSASFSPSSYIQLGDRFGASDGAVDAITWASVFSDHVHTTNMDQEIHGRDGHDILVASNNGVQLYGDGGNDTLFVASTGFGNALLNGGTGYDTLDLGVFTENLTIDLNVASQTVSGMNHTVNSDSFEAVRTGSGDDTLTGKSGIAHNFLDGGQGIDVITGGTSGAINTVSYERAQNGTDNLGITLTLDGGGTGTVTPNATDAGADSLNNIQNIIGSAYDDTISGGTQNNIFYGLDGDDILSGGAGSDTLIGGAGSDTLDAGAADAARDVILYDHEPIIAGDEDTIQNFDLAVAGPDAIDISALKHQLGNTSGMENIHEANYFDLIREGILRLEDGGGIPGNDTFVKFDGDYIARIQDGATAAADYDWKHFITERDGEYRYNDSGANGDDVLVSDGIAFSAGGDGDDIIEIVSIGASSTIQGDGGRDTFIITGNDQFQAGGSNIYGGGDGAVDHDFDTVLLNDLIIDFDFNNITTNFSGIEILDLFGSEITNLGVDDVLNLSDSGSLVINDSSFGTTGTLSLHQVANDSEWFDMGDTFIASETYDFDLPEIDEAQYTTYKGSNGADGEVFIHVHDSVASPGSLA